MSGFFGQVPSIKASGGIGANPRTIWMQVNGDRQPAETIAYRFAISKQDLLGRSRGKFLNIKV